MLSAKAIAWRDAGRFLAPLGHRLFVRDCAGTASSLDLSATATVVLHGFPTSSYDFAATLAGLAAVRRVVLHDHVGFGLSDKPRAYGYTLSEQADQAVALWQTLGLRRVHIVAHDYGTSVATELVARHVEGSLPLEIASLTLSNGSVRLDLAKLTWPQRLLRNQRVGPAFARLASGRLFKSRIRKTFARPDALADDELEALWQLVTHNDGRAVMSQISQYLRERVRHADRWLGALASYEGPAHLIWGQRDPIAVPAIAEALHATMPQSQLVWLPEAGHYPMAEAPDAWAAAVVAAVGSTASASKR